ncbi:MAG: CoA transferase [Gammaproteobacteria bacterium]|nr:CoA transferase [Gammaproteobacteria bacterium]
MSNHGPMQGIRVIEMGQLLAGPFTGHMLAYFGADVIKIESPGSGDPIRSWRMLEEGTSYWWRSLGRNKQSVTLNLKSERGRELARDLILSADVLIENFRPGKMESWGLGPEVFAEDHPSLVYTRVSGYGQTGPYSSKPGFASACEAMGGFRHINGFPDRPPVRPNLSIGDTLAGMHAVMGTLMALFHRERSEGQGQVVDVSILESVYNLMESVVPEYSGTGAVRAPSGSTLTGIVPTNTYLCGDGKYVVIGGNGDSIFKRLMKCAECQELADDPRLADNQGRVEHETEIDAALSAWTGSLNSADVLDALEQAAVPSAPIYTVEDMARDPHFRERGMFETVTYDDKSLEVPSVHPRLTVTPGETRWAGPALGEHTDQVLAAVLSLDAETIADLHRDGVV